MKQIFVDLLVAFDWFVLVYFLVLNSSYLWLVLSAASVTTQSLRRPEQSSHDDIFANPLTPPISVLLAAYNEEDTVLEATKAMLGLRYPKFEVVIIDDGSTDATFERLRAEYDLVETIPDLEEDVENVGEVLSMHVPRSGAPVVVVRKRNAGKAAAMNTGLNAARYPLVCCVDGDSILETDALLFVVKPFVDEPDLVVATGGVIRPVNGSTVHNGQISRTRQPRSWLARIQIVEYLRSFLLGRTGWSRFGAIVIISGAFGLYRRDLLVEVGGFDPNAMGEDIDVLLAMHRRQLEAGREYRVVCVPEPVCWTEVPTTLSALGSQRRRWSNGLAQVLWKQRGMIARPRYGRIGMVALPYYVVFELLGPVIELVGFGAVILGLLLGVVSLDFFLLFVSVALLYSTVVSIAALLVEEVSYHRYRRWRDVWIGAMAAVLENIGYRQMHTWWRLCGLVGAIRSKEQPWGEMVRTGFEVEHTAV